MRTLSTHIRNEIAKDAIAPRAIYRIEVQSKDTGATVVLCWTNHDSDLSFQGQTYLSYRVGHSDIKTYLENRVDNCTVTVDNVDKAISSYFAYNEFAGQQAEIYKVFLDINGDVIDGYTEWPTSSAVIVGDIVEPVTPNDLSYTCTQAGTTSSGEPTWPVSIGETVNDGTAIWECTGTNDDKLIQFIGFMDRPKVSESVATFRIVNVFDRTQSYSPWRRFNPACNWDFCGDRCAYNSSNGKPRGRADSGTTLTLTDGDLGSYTTDYWVGGLLKILDGINKGEIRLITGYNNTTKTFTVISAFSTAIDSTSKYIVECDKSKSTCSNFNNFPNFGGYQERLWIWYAARYSNVDGPFGGTQWAGVRELHGKIMSEDRLLPIVYGEGTLKGALIAQAGADLDLTGLRLYDAYTKVYGFCEGEIEEILDVQVNGNSIDTANTYSYQERLGTPGQSLEESDFSGSGYPLGWAFRNNEVLYFKDTVFVGINGWISRGGSSLSPRPPWFYGIFNTWLDDTCDIRVKGLKIQKYLADGSPDGSPTWSDNPSWCILDFLLNRTHQKLDSSFINFAAFHKSAQQCETFEYKTNLVLEKQISDRNVTTLLLTSCRGYFTYTSGKIELNIESEWIHPELGDSTFAHSFDDTSSGKTEDNISSGSFNYFQKDVNDVKNRIVVKYIDQEIRENMALIGPVDPLVSLYGVMYLPKTGTTIPFGDLQGYFSSSGTVYIGGEEVTYTGKTSTTLTGCSVRQKDYPSGYPCFVGPQTFPQMTAFYNDYDEQDKRKRVNEHNIDGLAVPTYRQAYDLAEWHGRQSVGGNLFSTLVGLQDSLRLTVGDVVALTHELSGWVDVEFRVTEASESENEEVTYTLKLYDESFYVKNDSLPTVQLITTLPDPNAIPEHVTNLQLVEDGYTNVDGIYIPTLTLTYDIPEEASFWDYGKVSVRTEIEDDYREYGDDISRGAGFVLDGATGKFSVGQTVYVRVNSVSTSNVVPDYNTAPTVSNKIDGLVVSPSIPSGLQLEGGSSPVDYTWDGLRFTVVWRGGSQTGGAGNEPAGQELQGAGGVAIDPFWKYDEVEVWMDGTLRHTFNTTTLRFEYIYGDGLDAFLDSYMVAANGAVTIKVKRWNIYNMASDQAEITLNQAAPANPSGLVATTLFRSARFDWDKTVDTDFSHFQVRTKVTSGGSWGAWESLQTNTHTRALTDTEVDASGLDAVIFSEVRAVDLYDNLGSASTAFVASKGVRATDIVAGTIKSQVITLDVVDTEGDVAIKAGKTDFGSDTVGFILGIDDSDNNKVKFEIGDADNYMKWDGSALNIRGVLNADDIVAGSIRGINITSGSYLTKGSYLTSALSGGESTINIKDTTDFPTSGTGRFIDSTNDEDLFYWTGKTATTLTGCTSVQAHNLGALVIPRGTGYNSIIVDDATNETRVYVQNTENASLRLGEIADYDIDYNYFEAAIYANPKQSSGWSRPFGLYSDANIRGRVTGPRFTAAIHGAVHGDAFINPNTGGSSYKAYPPAVYGKVTVTEELVSGSGGNQIGVYGEGVPYDATSEPYGGVFKVDDGVYVEGAPLRLIPAVSASAPSHTAKLGSLWVTSVGVLYINTSGSTTWGKVGAQ